MAEKHDKALILWFDDISIEDIPMVGGKNASLGEMYQKLTSKGVTVPHGFAITAYAYQYLLKAAGIEDAIRDAMDGLDTHDMHNPQERGKKARNIIRSAKFPDDLKQAIVESYKKMEEKYGANVDVAVRSSATAEDLPDASFAGQQETFLNVRGPDDLIDNCRKCFASLFTNRAISYRHDKGFGQFDVYLSIAVQKMIRSDSASSGVIFKIDTESGFKDAVFITASWGLGKAVNEAYTLAGRRLKNGLMKGDWAGFYIYKTPANLPTFLNNIVLRYTLELNRKKNASVFFTKSPAKTKGGRLWKHYSAP